MSINLVLNSDNSLFYNAGLARFFVNWSQFFEDDSHAKYDMTFSFASKPDATIDDDDLFVVQFDNLGSTLKTITPIGQNGVGSTSSTIMGIVKPEKQTGSNNRLITHYLDNPPVTIWGRPNENLLEVSFKDLDNVLANKEPHFVMIVRFQKL
tara:strand:+ start:2133 stop:2588 length:456 start_codon:yes stop_codon:yes gene_type:complete